mmetsp:Transcript_27252/g.60533  ORF Transcript_27252/g.60533 Transcript_27252/m.60533 type:complete len:371 (+) Transcript_27252:96-1208(+)
MHIGLKSSFSSFPIVSTNNACFPSPRLYLSGSINLMQQLNRNGDMGTPAAGSGLPSTTSSLIKDGEVDSLNGLGSNLGSRSFGIFPSFATNGVRREVVIAPAERGRDCSSRRGHRGLLLRITDGTGTLGDLFPKACHLLPFLEAAKTGAIAHLFANGRPGDSDPISLHHLGELNHAGIGTYTELLADDSFESLGFFVLPTPFDEFGGDLAMLVAAGVGRPVELGLNCGPLLTVPLNVLDELLDLIIGPGTAPKGVELPQTVAVNRLDGAVGQGSGNLHPGALELGLVVAFAAKAGGGDALGGAVLLDGPLDLFGFLLAELARRLSGCGLAVSVLGPAVVLVRVHDGIIILTMIDVMAMMSHEVIGGGCGI